MMSPATCHLPTCHHILITMHNVILTGFMGTGKSTVGRLLAARLGYRFVDTDEWIVAQDGRSIPAIFAQSGEAAFRRWEVRASQTLAAERGLVIATGGGLLLNPANVATLSATGPIFCLTARPETIWQRLEGDGTERPLLNHLHPARRIQELLQERAEAYGRFPQIPTDDRTPEQIVEQIAQHLDA
jgi:shikimate kinase